MLKLVFLLLVVYPVQTSGTIIKKRAALTYKGGEVVITSDRGKDIELAPGQGGRLKLNGTLFTMNAASITCNKPNEGAIRYNGGALEVCNGVRFVAVGAKLGSRKNPAKSCAVIYEDDWSAPSGAYYLETNPNVTKVYCHMENILGCGGGGWTTIMKTNGHKDTFAFSSALWTNMVAYHVSGGQAGLDHQETKLPTYWTLGFSRVCLGMSLGGTARWISLNYKANSLYSVIADGRYRAFSLGRNSWKSLIAGSSLQLNCNREGFNTNGTGVHTGFAHARIGIIGNDWNNCNLSDSFIGFGTGGTFCGITSKITTGNVARCLGDNGDLDISAFGYILAQ